MQSSEGDSRAWLKKVHGVQTSRLTPEKREELLQRVQRSQQAEKSRLKVKAARGHAVRSKALMSEGLRQMEAVSAPSQFKEVHDRWAMAQEASEQRQVSVFSKVDARSAASEAIVMRAEESDEEEADGMAEAAMLVGAAEPAQLARATSGDGPDDEFQKLLQQLRKEPSDDEEMTAKFGLYETYGQQVEKMRGTLFGLYEDNKPTLPDSVNQDMDKQLKKIDRAEAMGIPDDARGWFVYHMMAQAGRNNEDMSSVMEGFEKKLEFLSKNDQDECPICLDAFSTESPAETLGCCHKVCRECWANWSTVMHGRPFCPLCRNDEFVEALHRMNDD